MIEGRCVLCTMYIIHTLYFLCQNRDVFYKGIIKSIILYPIIMYYKGVLVFLYRYKYILCDILTIYV